jgi:hypothetical protein
MCSLPLLFLLIVWLCSVVVHRCFGLSLIAGLMGLLGSACCSVDVLRSCVLFASNSIRKVIPYMANRDVCCIL